VLESLLEPLDLTLNALALPPVVFGRKAGLQFGDLCGECRDIGSKGIAFIACAAEITVEIVYQIAFSEHL
jgi:hypothetical protein